MGKIIGALLGFAVGGPLLAIVGLVAGHFFDRGLVQAMRFDYAGARDALQKQFFESCFRTMGHIAKADGRVCESEIAQAEAIIRQLGLKDDRRQDAIRLFKEGSASEFQLEPEMSRFLKTCGRQPVLVKTLLEAVFAMALADGEVDAAERDILGRVAHFLGMSPGDFDRLLRMAMSQQHFYRRAGQAPGRDQLAQAYEALGVSASASKAEVKKAYRKLMSEHHPDKLIAKGVPEDMLRIATEKSQDIQAAYDLIEKSRKASQV